MCVFLLLYPVKVVGSEIICTLLHRFAPRPDVIAPHCNLFRV